MTPRLVCITVTVCSLLPTVAWSGDGRVDTCPGQHVSFKASAIPKDFLERSTWLWRFEDPLNPAQDSVFFGVTSGNTPTGPSERYHTWPSLVVRLPEGWRMVSLEQGFSRFVWVHAAAAPSLGYLWGFLQYSVEGPGSAIPVIMSMDRGKTWAHVATIKLPDEDAVLRAFEINPKGRGHLRVESGRDTPSGTRRLFTYFTRDWGRHWSARPTVEVSLLQQGNVPQGEVPCWVAAQNLPSPLPEACLYPDEVRRALH